MRFSFLLVRDAGGFMIKSDLTKYCVLKGDCPLFLWQRRRKICGVRTNSIYDTLPQMLPASRESEFLL